MPLKKLNPLCGIVDAVDTGRLQAKSVVVVVLTPRVWRMREADWGRYGDLSGPLLDAGRTVRLLSVAFL